MPVTAINNPNLTRSAMPALTTTEAISITDRANNYRPVSWLDEYGEIAWLNRMDSPILRALEANGFSEVQMQPKFEWIEASKLFTASLLDTAINSSTQYLKLADPGIVNKGKFLYAPGGEWMEVLEMDLNNGLSGGTNVKVTRGYAGTVATAHSAGATMIASVQVMGEKDIPRVDVGTMPGLSQYNFVTVFGKEWSSTRAANFTEVKGDWGTSNKEQAIQTAKMRMELGQSIFWQPRFFENNATLGPRYFTGGFSNFIKSNVLNLDNDPSRHTWDNLGQFFQNLFRHEASSGQKVGFVGADLFHAHKRIAREMGRLGEVAPDAVKLGEQDFTFNTEFGDVRYTLARNDFPQNPPYNLGGYGFFLDMPNVRSGTYLNYGFTGFYEDLEDRRQRIQIKSDAVVGSYWLAPYFEATHGIIKGAPKSLDVARAELLG